MKYPGWSGGTGKRGCGPALAQLVWGLDETKYYDFAQKNLMCIIIIEEKEAADNVEELAKVPGIDVLFIGFADMTYS